MYTIWCIWEIKNIYQYFYYPIATLFSGTTNGTSVPAPAPPLQEIFIGTVAGLAALALLLIFIVALSLISLFYIARYAYILTMVQYHVLHHFKTYCWCTNLFRIHFISVYLEVFMCTYSIWITFVHVYSNPIHFRWRRRQKVCNL